MPHKNTHRRRPSIKECDEIQAIVCREDELMDNSMKVVKFGKYEVMLVKQNSNIFAIGTNCPHNNAPLCNAALGNGRIRCQWHGACFNIKTGDIEDLPLYNALPTYKVTIVDEQIVVTASEATLTTSSRVKTFIGWNLKNEVKFVIVGGGPASLSCLKHLRENGFDGRILFIIGEKNLPYDRTRLSKCNKDEFDDFTLQPDDFFLERDVELKVGVMVSKLDYPVKKIELNDNTSVRYDKLFLATGSRPKHLYLRGSRLQNIFTLRDLDDYEAIHNALTPDSLLVIIGASFIGMEVAATLLPKVKSVTVVEKEPVPFHETLGFSVGRRLMGLFQAKGVHFEMGESVAGFVGENKNRVTGVILRYRRLLRADICIIAIGTVRNTEFIKADISLTSKGCIEVDSYLKTVMTDVYAGGDIASAPVRGGKQSIEHWQVASYHGMIAALNMVGQNCQLNTIPFFCTTFFDISLRYCGFSTSIASTQILIIGDMKQLTFVAFYINEKTTDVEAVLTSNRDPVASCFGELLVEKKKLQAKDIEDWLRGK